MPYQEYVRQHAPGVDSGSEDSPRAAEAPKLYIVEKDEEIVGLFETEEEGREHVERLVTRDFISLLPSNRLRVEEETEDGTLAKSIYATYRDTFIPVERMHTRVSCRAIGPFFVR